MPRTRGQHQPQVLRLFPFFLRLVYWIVKHSGSKWKGVGKKTSCHISKISIFCLREACGDLKKLGFSARCREMWNLNRVTQLKSWALFHTCKLVHLPFLSSPFSLLSVRDYYKIPSPFYGKKELHSCAPVIPRQLHDIFQPLPGVPDLFPVPGRSCWALTQPLRGCNPLLTYFLPSAVAFLVLRYQVMPCSESVLCPSLGCKHSSLQGPAVPCIECG